MSQDTLTEKQLEDIQKTATGSMAMFAVFLKANGETGREALGAVVGESREIAIAISEWLVLEPQYIQLLETSARMARAKIEVRKNKLN